MRGLVCLFSGLLEKAVNYAEIKYFDIANGAGTRTTLFVSGCTHHCEGCFQPQTWSFEYGKPFTSEVEDKLIESMKPSYVHGLTLLGGEPMEPANQRRLVDFLERVKRELPKKDIWCFTGDLYEDLLDGFSLRHTEVTERMLACIDVLVDGPYMKDLHDISLRFRGSSNQRIIDLNTSRASGKLVLWQDEQIYATHSMD